MAEWLYEQGIGENRAILTDGDTIIEAAIELRGTLGAGTIADGRLTSILVPGRRGIVRIGDGEAVMEPLPGRLTEGQTVRVEIVREAIGEEGRPKLARCRPSDEMPRPGPSLAERIGALTRHDGPGPDRFEQAGWWNCSRRRRAEKLNSPAERFG